VLVDVYYFIITC